MNRRNFLHAAVFGIVLAATARSSAEEEQDEYAVKAAYLYNFCNYVRWPRLVVPGTITIGVTGPALADRDAAGTIRDLNGQTVAARKIVLREFVKIEQYQPCDMVYVTGAVLGEPDLLAKIVKLNANKPVLIVSEAPDGLKRGATINFVRIGKTIKLEIKRAAATQANLVINAKLLRLAVNGDAQ